MTKIPRAVDLADYIQKGKVVVLYGPRQVGKTTLVKSYIDSVKDKSQYLTGDDRAITQELSKRATEETSGQLNGYEFKWKKKKIKPPSLWLDTYENSTFEIVDQDNYLDFITS